MFFINLFLTVCPSTDECNERIAKLGCRVLADDNVTPLPRFCETINYRTF